MTMSVILRFQFASRTAHSITVTHVLAVVSVCLSCQIISGPDPWTEIMNCTITTSRHVIQLEQFSYAVSKYEHIGTNNPCKNAVSATKFFLILGACVKHLLFPNLLLSLLNPREPIKNERHNKLHNNKLHVIGSHSPRLRLCGTLRNER